jgi:hypothetical protein
MIFEADYKSQCYKKQLNNTSNHSPGKTRLDLKYD